MAVTNLVQRIETHYVHRTKHDHLIDSMQYIARMVLFWVNRKISQQNLVNRNQLHVVTQHKREKSMNILLNK